MVRQAGTSSRSFQQFLNPSTNRPALRRPHRDEGMVATCYEEIAYLGRRPETGQLEAVVYIKQPGGYGEHQGVGSLEYLRFYVSSDRGESWVDHGSVWFPVWDIPTGDEGVRPLAFGITHAIRGWLDPQGKRASVLVRAILSWNLEPPPRDPDFKPIWGCVCDTHFEPEHQWGGVTSHGVLGFA